MFGIRSYRAKLQTAFVLLGLTAIAVTGWDALHRASDALRRATYDRLTAITETKRRTVERYFQDIGDHVLALSSDESSISALEEFRAAWPGVPPLTPQSKPAQAVDRFYAEQFGAEQKRWMPGDPRVRALQHALIVSNPHPPNERQQLLIAPALGRYGDLHARYHPTLHRYQSAFGFYDIFLIDADDGRILYTVRKEIDVGMRLSDEPYSSTGLANAWRRARELSQPETFVTEDYTPYVASNFAPAAFFASPIWRRGVKIGILAIQVSVDDLNDVMTSGRNWLEEGLGRTGQSYIVGPDRMLRSDVRFEIEQPEEFHRRLAETGVDRDTIERIRRNRTAILNLRVPESVVREIQSSRRGTDIGRDLRGIEVLRTHVPLRIPGLDWMLTAEIETAEAFASITALQWRILGWGASIATLFLITARLLARSVTRPVLALASSAERLGRRDFDAHIEVDSRDEIGELASAFNRMAEDLRRTTVSKESLEVLAGRLIGAQEEERTKIGRELHDDLTQRVAALAIELGRIERLPPNDIERLRAGLARVKQQTVQLSEDIHQLSRSLHPSMLNDLGLSAAVESECRTFFEHGGPPVDFRVDGSFDDLPKQIQLAVYRIIQESLRNIQRHASAEEVIIRLRQAGDELELTIRDNGRGSTKPPPGGMEA